MRFGKIAPFLAGIADADAQQAAGCDRIFAVDRLIAHALQVGRRAGPVGRHDAAESVGAGQNESDDTAYAKQRGSGKPFAGESAKQQCNAANCENNQTRTKILAGHDQAERAQIAENKLGVRAGRADLLHLLARVDQLVRHPDA